MLKRLFCCLLFVFVVGVSWSYAQHTPTTQGTEFWVSFMRNGHRGSNVSNDKNRLIISAKEDCTVTISNDNSHYSRSFSVAAGQVSMEDVPDSFAYNSGSEGVANTGVHVVSTKDISLYIGNEADNSYDASNVLPVGALGTEYMLQSYNAKYANGSNYPDDIRASFLIVAAENGTTVEITPTVTTTGGHPANQPYEISLSRGQAYHVMTNSSSNNNTAGDFSGTRVVSNKPVAVFNGNCLTAVPGGGNTSTGYDHVFEQAMPTNYWGKKFVVTSTRFDTSSLGDDEVKVTALNDNTEVTRNDGYSMSLNAGESASFTMNLNSQPCYYLESNNPVAVYLYNHSHGSGMGTQYGDPSMVWISPVEQTIEEITFSTFQVQQINAHYVNIVCYSEDANELVLTGSNTTITPSFTQVPGHPEFSYVRQSISHGIYTLHCPGGFIAHVYGIGQAEGYAYSVGSSAKTLTTQLFVNGESYDNYPDGYTICQNHEVEFRVEANFDIDHVVWQFTDGYSDTGETISRNFDEEGTFEMEVYVYHDEEAFERMMAAIHVSPVIEIPVDYSTCASTYRFHGQDFPVPYFEDFIIHSEEGCDTIYHMNIQSNPSVSAPLLYETICEEDEGYMWFDTLRTEPGTYLVIAQSPAGCDSVCLLHLEVDKVPENPERAVSSCTPYHWGADIVCDHTDDYHRTFLTQEGLCEYDSVLHFTLLVSPLFEQIVGLSNVAVATNFWPGQYLYYLDDSTGIATERVRWELMGNPEGAGHWELIPRGASCTVIAYSMGERVLWVSTGDGPCDREAFKTINCTGYGVDENEMVNLEIYPNPAKDELVVKGPEMQELTIYNLLGQKMCSVSANGGAEVKLEVGGLPQALYLLEVRTSRGNKTRLVSVIN